MVVRPWTATLILCLPPHPLLQGRDLEDYVGMTHDEIMEVDPTGALLRRWVGLSVYFEVKTGGELAARRFVFSLDGQEGVALSSPGQFKTGCGGALGSKNECASGCARFGVLQPSPVLALMGSETTSFFWLVRRAEHTPVMVLPHTPCNPLRPYAAACCAAWCAAGLRELASGMHS